MAFVDIKHTIWQRYQILDEKLEEFMKLDEKDRYEAIFHEIIDNATDSEYLYDTLDYITPAENQNNPTVELFDESYKAVWDNTPLEIKRDRKIAQIQK